jgi:hypothetical protein
MGYAQLMTGEDGDVVRGFLSQHVAMGAYRPVRLALEQRTNALAGRICADLATPSVLSRGLLRQTVKQLLSLGLQDLVRPPHIEKQRECV